MIIYEFYYSLVYIDFTKFNGKFITQLWIYVNIVFENDISLYHLSQLAMVLSLPTI